MCPVALLLINVTTTRSSVCVSSAYLGPRRTGVYHSFAPNKRYNNNNCTPAAGNALGGYGDTCCSVPLQPKIPAEHSLSVRFHAVSFAAHLRCSKCQDRVCRDRLLYTGTAAKWKVQSTRKPPAAWRPSTAVSPGSARVRVEVLCFP